MAVTMRDVAQLAGVSPKTVSNVLNDYPHISEATRRKVEDAIEKLGYRVNVQARQLRRGRTGLIGLAVPDLRVPYFAELAYAFMESVERRGYTLLLEQTGPQGERELETLLSDRRQLTDGLLFSPMSMDPTDTRPLYVDYPMVLLGERIFGGPTDHVTMSNVAGAKAAVRHLFERGRTKIAVLGEHPHEEIGSAGLRLQGYLEAHREAGIEVDQRRIAAASPWVYATGAEAMSRVLESGVDVDGVFAMNDGMALGALRVLHERDLRVPEDVAVIGFDDIAEATYSVPSLSTVAVGRDEIVETSVDQLLERIQGYSGPPRLTTAKYRLIERDSTGASSA